MDFYTLSDKYIAKELGSRLKRLRLQKNVTQERLKELTDLSLNTIKNAEKGQCKLLTLIAILRALNALDNLNAFLPNIPISPIQLAKMNGNKRQRASATRTNKEEKESKW